MKSTAKAVIKSNGKPLIEVEVLIDVNDRGGTEHNAEIRSIFTKRNTLFRYVPLHRCEQEQEGEEKPEGVY